MPRLESKPRATARRTAWKVLRRLRLAADTPLPVLLDQAAQAANLDSRDTRLLTLLVYGVLRNEQRLEQPLAERLDKMPGPDLRLLLLLGAYEILFTEIPAHASVNEYAGLARKAAPGLAGLTNAVLRRLERERAGILEQDAEIVSLPPEQVTAPKLALLGSLPLWLAENWVQAFGGQTALRLADSARCQPPLSYRINLARLAACRDFFGPDFDLEQPGLVGPAPELEQAEALGLVSRQGQSSITAVAGIAAYLQNDPDLAEAPIWDACCGRGNKSCALLERGLNLALASDPNQQRLDDFAAALARLNLPAPRLVRSTLQDLAEQAHWPVIILDAPCSGSGTLARNPELRQRLSRDRIQQAAVLQAELLDKAWPALAGGGLLAYLTCSLEQEENERQISRLLQKNPDAHLAAQDYLFPELPGSDSLFLALLRKS